MYHYYDVFFADNGAPVAGGTVTVYTTGTLAPATLYSDNGVTTKPNPVTTDSLGRFDFYIANGVYDLVFAGLNVSQITRNSVEISNMTQANVNDLQTKTQSLAIVATSGYGVITEGSLPALSIWGGWPLSYHRSGLIESAPGGAGAFSGNEFLFYITLQANPTSSQASLEKAALFIDAVTNDPSTNTIRRNAVGIDSRATIASTNSNGAVWGGVFDARIQAGGDGQLYGIEIDLDNNGSNVASGHADDSGFPAVKTGIWLSNSSGGITNPGTWMFDSANSGPGFRNGFSIRNIVSGGIGLQLPNNIPISFTNAAGNGTVNAAFADGSNNLQIGFTANAVVLNARSQFNVGVAQGSGVKHQRVSTGSINATTRVEVILTWTTPFADANYSPVAMVVDSTTAAGTQGLTVERIRTWSATQVGVVINNPTAGALTGTLIVIGIHD